MLDIKIEKAATLKAKPTDESKLGFGNIFTDHMFVMEYDAGIGWHDPRIVPYAPFSLDPACVVFHYAQEIFEGMKAYRTADNKIQLFRPDCNANRMNDSADRLCIPNIDPDDFVQAVKALVEVEKDWVPHSDGASLYLRPFTFATDVTLGVHASKKYTFCIIASPSGAYYAEGINPVRIYFDEAHYDSPKEEASPSSSEPAAKPVSDTLQKMINFRKRFPFLNDAKCPDVLKVLVADMFTAYGKMRDAHQQLTQVPDDKMAPELTETVLDNFLEDRAIMAELEYYRDNGQLLGKHPKVAAQSKTDEISSMSDFELAKAMKNAMSNVSKASLAIQRNPDKIEENKARLAKWTARKEAIQAEIERRSNSN